MVFPLGEKTKDENDGCWLYKHLLSFNYLTILLNVYISTVLFYFFLICHKVFVCQMTPATLVLAKKKYKLIVCLTNLRISFSCLFFNITMSFVIFSSYLMSGYELVFIYFLRLLLNVMSFLLIQKLFELKWLQWSF